LIGGAGFIGHNIAMKPKQTGAEPHIIDSLRQLRRSRTSERQPQRRSMSDSSTSARCGKPTFRSISWMPATSAVASLASIKPDIVVQLAASLTPTGPTRIPTALRSLDATLENALDTVRDRKPHLLFCPPWSTVNPEGEAYTEEMRLRAAESGAEVCRRELVIAPSGVGLPYTIVRPSALYGELPSAVESGRHSSRMLRGLT
jgi:nucleoside-diphosphate-sugar epimerase